MLRILVVVILCQTILSMGTSVTGRAVSAAGALAITACCASDMQALMGLGQRTMDEISNFSGLLLPVMAAASAASGAPAGASAVYAVAAVFSDLLIRLCRFGLIPCIYGSVAMAMVDAALEQKRLQKLRELLEWAIRTGLKAVMYLFTGFLAITGILSGSADAAALKAAKLAFSGMIPVVGGILSDAAETVLASAGLLKSAAGTFGMLAVLAIFALPFCRMGISYLSFKGTSALCGILGSSQGGLLEAMTTAMGSLLAMTSSCAMMCMLSCCCFLRVVRL